MNRSLPLPAFLFLLAAGCAASGQGAHIPEADRGLWMTLDQTGELFARGTVRDSVGHHYNMHPIPGYARGVERADRLLDAAGRIYARYGEDTYWESMGDAQVRTRANLRAAGHRLIFETPKKAFTEFPEEVMEEVTWKWGLQGAGRAWRENFGIADAAVERRAFGWFLAYPWATLCSLGDNLIRVPIGVVGGPLAAGASYAYGGGCVVAGGGAYAVGEVGADVAIPVAYAVGPGAGGTAVGAFALVQPLPEWAWTTVATPGAAVLCGRPNPDRVVGRWFTLMNEPGDPRHKNDPARRILETLPQSGPGGN